MVFIKDKPAVMILKLWIQTNSLTRSTIKYKGDNTMVIRCRSCKTQKAWSGISVWWSASILLGISVLSGYWSLKRNWGWCHIRPGLCPPGTWLHSANPEGSNVLVAFPDLYRSWCINHHWLAITWFSSCFDLHFLVFCWHISWVDSTPFCVSNIV